MLPYQSPGDKNPEARCSTSTICAVPAMICPICLRHFKKSRQIEWLKKFNFVLGIFEKKILSNRKAETLKMITRIFELENSSKGKVQSENKV